MTRNNTSVKPAQALAIGPATRADIPVIVSLIRALAVYEKLEQEMVASEAMLEEALFGAKPAAEVLLARAGAEVIGFCLFFPNFSTFVGKRGIYIEDLFVLPTYRGAGAGKALFVETCRLAKERGCGRVEWAVLDWNTPAIEFYKRSGARQMNEWQLFRLTEDTL